MAEQQRGGRQAGDHPLLGFRGSAAAKSEVTHVNDRSRSGIVGPSGLETLTLDGELPLDEEAALSPCRIGVEDVGHPDGPVVVALGGISADGHVCAHDGRPVDGWWEPLVGPGRALDTGAVRVIGMDWIGGPGRSSAPPPAEDPARIPIVTTGDQARALAAVLDHLGIDRVDAVIGASYGAMVALAFGARHPERASRVVAISGAHESHPMATALRGLQRQIALLGRDAGDPKRGLVLARALAMTSYRTALEFHDRFDMVPSTGPGPIRFPVEAYLEHQGRSFAERFELEHFLCLGQSLDLHRVDPAQIRAPTTLLAVEEDTLVPLWQMRELERGLGALGELVVIRSPYGHDAFLVEEESVGAVVRAALPVARGEGGGRPDGSPTDAR